MGDQIKKISFGFSKLAKKPAIISTNANKIKQDDDVSKVEFIDCLEGKSIKLKDPIKIDQGPLIIPLTRAKEEKSSSQQVNSENVQVKDDQIFQNKPTSDSNDIISKESGISDKIDEINKSDGQNKNETLDEIAAREILEELNRQKAEDDEKRVFSVPLTSNAPAGEKESTLEDYDKVPVLEFGMAALRGMGWEPGKGIGKNAKHVAPTLPAPRPKGMGLGADKVIKSVEKKSSNEELKMVKGSFIRVLAGSEKDSYGQIEGFDDQSGRLIVKLALKNVSISLNEFMVQLVDANEFKKNSKVINVSKYEQYKEDEIKKESSDRSRKPQEEGHKKTSKYEQYKDHEIRKESCERRSQDDGYKRTSNKELVSHSRSEKFDNKSKVAKKNRSSSCESQKDVSSDFQESKSTRYRTSPSRLSRSPSGVSRIKESSHSQGHKFNPSKHETSSRDYKSSTSDKKKHRSYSSGSSGSSSSYNNRTRQNKSKSAKTHVSVKDRSVSRRRSNSDSSTSDSSRGNKKSKRKNKKSSMNSYRSRSRSRSPRRHKHKKSKK